MVIISSVQLCTCLLLALTCCECLVFRLSGLLAGGKQPDEHMHMRAQLIVPAYVHRYRRDCSSCLVMQDKPAKDNRNNQLNPNNPTHEQSRSGQTANDNNRANQLNPNHSESKGAGGGKTGSK